LRVARAARIRSGCQVGRTIPAGIEPVTGRASFLVDVLSPLDGFRLSLDGILELAGLRGGTPCPDSYRQTDWKGPRRKGHQHASSSKSIVWTLKSRRIIEPTAGVVNG